MRLRTWVLLAALLLALTLAIARRVAGPREDARGGTSGKVELATFVGESECASCHKLEHDLWLESDHRLAMQEATTETVLGDFDGPRFTYRGDTSRFFTRDGKFIVETDGPDGKLEAYPIEYAFGVRPLQQYLIRFPGGRYQALSIAWDSRPRREGGERWYHLYRASVSSMTTSSTGRSPHKTGYMCAECHSTNLRKSYDLETNLYDTTWSEINVSCEACHGPGSRHVAQAKAAAAGRGWPTEDAAKGLAIRFKERAGVTWNLDPATGSAKRSQLPGERPELEACARCHSRRSVLWTEYEHGRPLLDTHRPALLEEGLYYPDGQIRDEVYEYASFLQSKMYQKGVTCSDCHDPHSGKLRGSTNLVCVACHTSAVFETPSHHFHKPGGPGSGCVDCHMPQRNYMVVDPRRDHSLRVPRPDLTSRLDAPDPCTDCHKDRSGEWADSAVTRWYGAKRRTGAHYGDALHAGERGLPGAEEALSGLALSTETPGVVRATALSLLGRYASPRSLPAIEAGLRDADPLVRLGAAQALEGLPSADRLRLGSPLLKDPVRAVRLEAVVALGPVPANEMSPDQSADMDRVAAEYREAQLTNADQPWAHLNIGLLEARRGNVDKADEAYKRAIRIDPVFVPAYVNLADLMRESGREGEGERLLREATALAPKNGDTHHALGLLLVRAKRLPEAISSLERAAELKPQDPHYGYVLAVALDSEGKLARALAVLEAAHRHHPIDREILVKLVFFNEKSGRRESAIGYARKLLELAPDDPEARRQLRRLEGAPLR